MGSYYKLDNQFIEIIYWINDMLPSWFFHPLTLSVPSMLEVFAIFCWSWVNEPDSNGFRLKELFACLSKILIGSK